jgi:hypothetical protein
VVLNAFKIACLSYNPQPVTYNGVTLSRHDLFMQENEKIAMAWAEFEETVSRNKEQLKNMNTAFKLPNPINFKTLAKPSNDEIVTKILCTNQGIAEGTKSNMK